MDWIAQHMRLFRAFAHLAFAAALAGLALPMTTAPVSAGGITIGDLLELDPLGYECIPSTYLEEGEDGTAAIAFSLTGKGRLPRTCLPDPCERALSPRELSNITGTEMILARFSGEWDDYYARYADYCRREVTFPPEPIITADGPVYPMPAPVADFWPPIIERARIIRRVGDPTTRQGRPITTGLLSNPPWGIPNRPGSDIPFTHTTPPRSIFMLTSAGGAGGYEPPDGGTTPPIIGPNTPAPVPVPPAGLLMLAALGLFALQRRVPTRR